MPEITVPSSIKDLEQVQSVRTPIKMEYTFTPGVAAQTYLREFATKNTRHYFTRRWRSACASKRI